MPSLKSIYGGAGGSALIPVAGQTYRSSAGFGIGQVSTTPVNTIAGVTVVTLTGKFALNSMQLNVNATGVSTCNVILTIDGKVVLSTTVSLAGSPGNFSIPIWGSYTTGASFPVSSPLFVGSSMTLFLQRSTVEAIGVDYNAIAIE